jgi:hypothetical protein
MNQAGSRVGARCWSGVRVGQAVHRGQVCPPFTALTSSTPAFDVNPTRPLPRWNAGGSSREEQEEKGRKR